MRWLIVAAVAATPLLVADAAPAAEAQKRVLILSEFRPDTPSNIERQNTLRNTLNAALNGSIDYYEEYMDAPALSDQDYQPALRDFLRRKYVRTRFDVLLVVGRTALQFVRTYGVELFPRTPVIALATDKELIEQRTPGLSVTGVTRRLDPKGTLDFILRLQPNTTQVALVAGGTDAPYFENLAREELRGYEGTVAFSYLIDLPIEDLLTRVATLPRGTAILYLGVNGDSSGVRLPPSIALARIVEAANAPVYGSIANHLDAGIVGGSLHDTNLLAHEAADMAVQLLRGERITNMPVRESDSVVAMANWPALQRWGLTESRLPPGTVVLRREPSLWARYRWQMIAVLSVLAAQGVTIAGLLVHRARRREIQRRNAAMLRAVPDLMFLHTKSGTYVDYYAQDSSALVCPPSQFLGRSFREVMPPPLAETLEQGLSQALVTPDPVVVEYWLRVPRGLRHFEARFVACGPDHVLSVVRDTTEAKQAEHALRESQERYALASVAGGVGVWDWNLQANEIYADSSLKTTLGYESHEIGTRIKEWGACIHPADLDMVKSHLREHLKGATPVYECEHRVIRRDGSVRWCLVRGSVLERMGSRAVRMTGTCTDITARKQAESELLHAKAELARLHRITTLSEVGAALAHEINQPLTVIMSNAVACVRLLERTSPDIGEVREALRDVIQDGKRARDIVAHTRKVFTRHEVETTTVDINALIRESCTLAQDRLQSARIILRTGLARHLPVVSGDRVELQQVLWNLMTNAIEAMRDTPVASRTLTIRSSLDRSVIQVAVEDAGPGISPVDAERMFEPFFTTKHEGMGMGLSISRTIIEAHGGRLWAARGATPGATFCFSLPVTASDEVPVGSPKRSARASRSRSPHSHLRDAESLRQS